MPFSSSALNKTYFPFLEKKLEKFNTDIYLSVVDKKHKLVYNVNYYNYGFISVYDLNTGEKIEEFKDIYGEITESDNCILLDEESQLLYIGTRYSDIIVFDLINRCYLTSTKIFIGYDIHCCILNNCLINNKNNTNKEKDDIICFCDDYVLRKFEWKLDENNKPILELVNQLYIQNELTDELNNHLRDVDSLLYNNFDNHIYVISSFILLKINNETFEITDTIDLTYYIQMININNVKFIRFEYNCLVYKDLLILISNRVDHSILIIINLQTQQKIYFNKILDISEICLGNNETEGLLFIIGNNNISVIDLLNIRTTLQYPKYYNSDNDNFDEAIYVLSPKSYLLNILQDINGPNSRSYRVDNLDIAFIENNELTLILDDRVIRKYKLDDLCISNKLYNWRNIFKNKIENNNLESIRDSKLNALNNDMLFKILESI